jgi:hypothetical protein
MLGKKKLLLSLAMVAVMLAGGITAGTQLLIEQPVSASITVEGIGGTLPSFNIIDNVFNESGNAHAGAAAAYISTGDFFVIDFGKKAKADTGDNWELSFGRSQTATVGNGGTDFVFKLGNNYANTMTVGLAKGAATYQGGGSLGAGVVIKIMNAATDTAQWTLTGAATPANYTITGSLTLDPGEEETFYLKVENDDATAGTHDPRVRFVATAD